MSLVQALHADPLPLCLALARYPRTLLHGDYKLSNLALLPADPPSVVLLDWALVAAGPPVVDLARCLGLSALRSPITKEESIARYQARLARGLGGAFDLAWRQPQLELALLGGFLRFGYWLAWLANRHPSGALRFAVQTDTCR